MYISTYEIEKLAKMRYERLLHTSGKDRMMLDKRHHHEKRMRAHRLTRLYLARNPAHGEYV